MTAKYIGITAALLVVAFGLGFVLGGVGSIEELPDPILAPPTTAANGTDFALFWETMQELQANFIDSGQFDAQEMLYGAISGMVDSLGDPYTVFLPPDDKARLLEDISGEFEGVGMEVGIRDDNLVVIAPLEGTPAQRAGLLPKDRIIQIDGTSTLDLSIDEAVGLIRGPGGTEVVLTLFREGWDQPRDFPIIRDTIAIPSVQWELTNDNLAHIRLFHFTQTADRDFREVALEVAQSEARGIVLDLRNNPGGFLEVAQNIAGWFLPRGEIVAIEEFSSGDRRLYRSPGPARLAGIPVVVVMNGGSASASEILAAALHEKIEAPLVGEQSFGKGSVQEVVPLSSDSALKVTVAHWLSPNENLINDVGLEPTVFVEITGAEEGDPQLERAIEILKELL